MELPIAELLRDHDDLLARLDATADRLATVTASIRELLAYVDSEVAHHFAREESTLFPALAGNPELAPGTIALLLDEHAKARALAEALGRAVQHEGVARQAALAQELIDLLRAHVAKEDAMLLAVAAVALR